MAARVSLKNVLTATMVYTPAQVRYLLAQVVHDLISGFSSLSAGLDLGPDPHLWPLVKASKEQLCALLCLFRVVFGASDGAAAEAQEVLSRYGAVSGISVVGSLHGPVRLTLGLAFWMMRQARPSCQPCLVIQESGLVLMGENLRPCPRDMWVVQGRHNATSARESYGQYLSFLAVQAGFDIHVHTCSDRLEVVLQARNLCNLAELEGPWEPLSQPASSQESSSIAES